MSRFTDDLVMIPVGQEWIPRTPSQLLHQLGVRMDSKEVQRKAVAKWLETNEPTPFLRRCLEMDRLVGEAPQAL